MSLYYPRGTAKRVTIVGPMADEVRRVANYINGNLRGGTPPTLAEVAENYAPYAGHADNDLVPPVWPYAPTAQNVLAYDTAAKLSTAMLGVSQQLRTRYFDDETIERAMGRVEQQAVALRALGFTGTLHTVAFRAGGHQIEWDSFCQATNGPAYLAKIAIASAIVAPRALTRLDGTAIEAMGYKGLDDITGRIISANAQNPDQPPIPLPLNYLDKLPGFPPGQAEIWQEHLATA